MANLAVEFQESTHGSITTFFPLAARRGEYKVEWLVLLDLEETMIVPTRAMPPFGSFLNQNRKLLPVPGLCWAQDGEPMPTLQYAALDAFLCFNKTQVRTRMGLYEAPQGHGE